MKKKKIVCSAMVLAAVLILSGAIAVFAASGIPGLDGSKYESVNVNTVTGQGQEPEDLSVSAASKYAEKEWYEYLTYSEKAVASYKINDNNRLVFYDPYDYNSSMIMNVSYDEKDGEWSTANSIKTTHTFSESFDFSKSAESTYTNSRESAVGQDYTRTNVTNSGTTVTEYNHKEDTNYNLATANSGTDTTTLNTTTKIDYKNNLIRGGGETVIGGETGFLGNIVSSAVTVKLEDEYTWGDEKQHNSGTETVEFNSNNVQTGGTISNVTGTDTITDNTSSVTEGWSTIADRVAVTTGTSIGTNSTWSSEKSTSIEKTFDAAYFNSSGAPLSWKIAYYEVKMPMLFVCQTKSNNEWITTETGYCLLTTIQGTCRAWRENTVTYYEHWGTGEPIAESDFWGSFFRSKEALIAAYAEKLYPNK